MLYCAQQTNCQGNNWSVKYAPDDSAENRDAAIRRELDALCMVKLKVEHMTGKEAIEPAGKRS